MRDIEIVAKDWKRVPVFGTEDFVIVDGDGWDDLLFLRSDDTDLVEITSQERAS